MSPQRIILLALFGPMVVACASTSGLNGWWEEASTNTVAINGRLNTFGEGWLLRPSYFNACGLRVGRFQEQVSLRLYKGSSRRTRLSLNRAEIIQGSYADEYGPRDPLRFSIEDDRLRLEWLFPGDTEARVTYFQRAMAPTDDVVLAAAGRCE